MQERQRPGASWWQRAVALLLTAGLAATGSLFAGSSFKPGVTLKFAAEMAEQGSWREARYRWQQVLAHGDENPRLLNNLAVAAEAMGDLEEAGEYYRKALRGDSADARILDNYRRYERVVAELEARDGAEEVPGDAPRLPRADESEGKGGKPIQVEVRLPIPPRLVLEGDERILVTSLHAPQSVLLDVNQEIVRFLRSEFRKHTDLHVIDDVPTPAIPEQPLEDLIRNQEFWKHLYREFDADLIVSGVISYSRDDVSGFQEVDVVSSRTGQKVRQTQFVEQEEFAYDLELIFIDGPTGTLRFRDRIRRVAVFRGLMNDPIHAFYELSDSIAADVLAVVTTRMRAEPRVIFRR